MEKIPAFVALDLETTGLDFEKDEIIEVALVRFENGEPKENLDFLVKPSSAELRPFIETLTGINKADLESAPDFATVAGQICTFIGDLPIVAHNALFDSKFLKQTFTKVGISYDSHVFWDSLTLSRIAFQDVPNHRLDTLVQELNIERSRAHRALPDADACGRLFVKALEKISSMDPWLFEALSKVAEGSGYETLFATKSESLAAPKYKLPEAPAPETFRPVFWLRAHSRLLPPNPVLQNIHIQRYRVYAPSCRNGCGYCGSPLHPRSRSHPDPALFHILLPQHPAHSFPTQRQNCRLPVCRNKVAADHADPLPRSVLPETSSPGNTRRSVDPWSSPPLLRWTGTADGSA